MGLTVMLLLATVEILFLTLVEDIPLFNNVYNGIPYMNIINTYLVMTHA